jgi:hypothetical protein
MATRNSEYELRENSLYETPEWVTEALLPFLGRGRHAIWDPCAGKGKMTRVLDRRHTAYASDLVLYEDAGTVMEFGGRPVLQIPGVGRVLQRDFLHDEPFTSFDGIVANPPFGHIGPRFLRHALKLTKETTWCEGGFVAMLFPFGFDAAPGRVDVFRDHPAFHAKITLTRRIVWFEPQPGKEADPSSHHAWYIWDWRRRKGPAIMEYV